MMDEQFRTADKMQGQMQQHALRNQVQVPYQGDAEVAADPRSGPWVPQTTADVYRLQVAASAMIGLLAANRAWGETPRAEEAASYSVLLADKLLAELAK